MPIPFIIAGIAAVAGAYGVKKGVDGYKDNKEANEVNDEAQSIYNHAADSLNKHREETNTQIKKLGNLKIDTYNSSLTEFVKLFKELKNTEELEYEINMEKGASDENFSFDKMSIEIFDITNILTTTAISASAGVAAGFGAFGGAGMLAAASTGTAISSLSGIAATNATLAWFGGGSLAAGGLGMAGGTAVLGGIVAGPVLAIAGSLFASKAEEAKHNAYSNLDKAKAARLEMHAAEVVVNGIKLRVNEIFNIIDFLSSSLSYYNRKFFSLIIKNHDYKTFSDSEKIFTKDYCNLAKTLKTVCDVPILDENGAVTKKSKEVLDIAEELRQKMTEAEKTTV